jgi:hypothetical protein
MIVDDLFFIVSVRFAPMAISALINSCNGTTLDRIIVIWFVIRTGNITNRIPRATFDTGLNHFSTVTIAAKRSTCLDAAISSERRKRNGR